MLLATLVNWLKYRHHSIRRVRNQPRSVSVPELKVGIQLSCLGRSLRRSIEIASRMGADAIELDARKHVSIREMSDTAIRQLRKMLDDANLKVCALGFQTRSGYNVADRLHERLEATKAAMDLAYRLGASVVVNQIGRVPEEQEGPAWDTFVDVLAELGKHAQRCGAFLAAETGSESGEALAGLIAALPEGSIGVTLNPGNLLINGFSAQNAVKSLREHTMYVRAKDGVRDLALGRGLEVPLGRGSADFPELIGLLEENEYRGYFTVARDKANDPVAEVSMAVEYLRNL